MATARNILPAYALQQLSRLIYPETCVGCGNPLPYVSRPVCAVCIKQLPVTHYEQLHQSPMAGMFAGRLAVERADAMLFFAQRGMVQHIIHAFKYQGRQDVGRFMGKWMAEKLLNAPDYPLPEAIVPLPLYRKKMKQRGYNQSALLAEGMAEVLQIPVAPVAVMRTRYTDTQTHKTRIERWLNVAEVFDLDNAQSLEGRKILLVDDVITTGATMEACGAHLLRIPGVRLSLLSLAFARSI